LKNLRRSHPQIPYTLEIECNPYWGNFEREFLAYSIGILDDVQMDIRHSKEELEMFWKEVFDKEPIDENDPLLGLDNCTLTNHRGGDTINSYSDSPAMMMKEAQKFFEGDTPKFWLNPSITR
jgi:hypothetical protein